MSKTLDALKKVSEMRSVSSAGTDFKSPDTSVHPSVASTPGFQVRDFMPALASYSTAHTGFNHDQSRPDSRTQNAVLILLTVVGLVSLLLSFRTLTEIRKVNALSSSAVKDLAVQKSKITALEMVLGEIRLNAETQEKAFKDRFNKMTAALGQNQEKISDLSFENRQLRSLNGELKSSLQNLNEKYSQMNTQIKSLNSRLKAQLENAGIRE